MSDLIVKGAGEIKDGLYNIKDGKLFQYKANGGTVRTYPIVSADRPKWIPCSKRLPEENEPVLVGIRYKDDFKMVVTARMDVTYWQGVGRDIKGEMRWMPLPEPYKESEE